jgi:hypothetical protein
MDGEQFDRFAAAALSAAGAPLGEGDSTCCGSSTQPSRRRWRRSTRSTCASWTRSPALDPSRAP